MNLLNKIWYHKHPLFYVLAPFSGLYRLALFFKQLAYRFSFKQVIHPPVPTIVVGNLTVGGTGKTPLIIALADFLVKNGYKPGIVSRGYGGSPSILPLHVDARSDPLQAGDEPVLIARKTNCPVVVDPNRVRAVRALLATYDCNLILSDDGLQHTQLGRDIEVVVVDGGRYFGNGWCLPAGPLREPIGRLAKVDFVVVRALFSPLPTFSMRLIPGPIYNLKHPDNLFTPEKHNPQNQPIHAVAGIGNPQPFFDQLRSLGFSIIEHAFADHHRYTEKELDFGPAAIILMTEKDAVKCESFAQNNYWCLPVLADCDSMLPQLLNRIILRRK